MAEDRLKTPIRVAVFGAWGRMGRQVCRAVDNADGDMSLVARVGRGTNREIAESSDVVVDFSVPDSVVDNVKWALDRGKSAVVGTTGLTNADVQLIKSLLDGAPGKPAVLVVPNFSKAAMLARQFCEFAAPHFSHAEILDFSHERKLDAPSGTSQDIAAAITDAAGADGGRNRGECEKGPRGVRVGDVSIHFIRMPGLLFHQEILFSEDTELLSIRFDTFDRVAFMPDILRAIRIATERRGLHVGLTSLYPDQQNATL